MHETARSDCQAQHDEIVSPGGAVAFLGGIVTEPTLQRYRSEGGGPKFIKLGPRKVGYRVSDLRNWVEQRIAASTADARERDLAA